MSDSRIRGTRYPPERKEKENIEHLILLTKFQRARKVCIPSKSKSTIRLPPLLSPSSPYTIHSPHRLVHRLVLLIAGLLVEEMLVEEEMALAASGFVVKKGTILRESATLEEEKKVVLFSGVLATS